MPSVYNVVVAIMCFIFGTMLIAYGACVIDWIEKGEMTVIESVAVPTANNTTTNAEVEVLVDASDMIPEPRRNYLKAMSAISIIIGIFIYGIGVGYLLPAKVDAVKNYSRKEAQKILEAMLDRSPAKAAVSAGVQPSAVGFN